MIENTAQTCIHAWDVWAWTGLLDVDRGHLSLRSACLRCGSVSDGSVPLGHRIGTLLPGQGALSAPQEQP